ncbi:MAG TPA: PASTA domain-containing protein [Gemmatimonadales bacterium]|nr:PASTA domain-containing protein [Gemmatimonadales bacterium]
MRAWHRATLGLGFAVVAGLAVAWLWFPTPLRVRTTTVPTLRGVPLEQALDQLRTAGLRGRPSGELDDPQVARGSVVWSLPVAGTVLPESAIVRLNVSAGPPSVLVPTLADLDLGTAGSVLEAAGLLTGAVDSQTTNLPAGIVLRSQPPPGKAVRAGESVNLVVSRGPRDRNR